MIMKRKRLEIGEHTNSQSVIARSGGDVAISFHKR